ncbi:MAG: hypothetical protein K8R08_08845 [Methanosarcinales archaeon]|nr:hypothetical protein [Methanosarcinales archaeon]
MNKEKIVDKIKHFWNDTEAISPIIATIMVLVVAVAAGAGLYFWFDTFQEGAQAEVGDSATGNIRTMSIGSAIVTMSSEINENFKLYPDEDNATEELLNNSENAGIWYAQSYPTVRFGPNGLDELGYHDERFILEIPVTISSSTELTDVKLKAGKIEVTDGNLHGHMWLHLDSESDYRLLNGDDTMFVGFINKSTDQVYENTTDGFTYYFGGKKHYGVKLNESNATMVDFVGKYGAVPDDPNSKSYDESDISPPVIARVPGALGVIRLHTPDSSYVAFAKDKNDTEYGWMTCNHSAGYTGVLHTSSMEDQYFLGGEKLEQFHNPVYKVVDTLNPNEAQTVSTYLFVTIMSLSNYETGTDDGLTIVNIPLTMTSKEGVTETMNVKFTVLDEDR